MAITFAVDDVTPAGSLRPTRPLAELVGAHMALAPARPVIETPAIHPLLAAVHVAFAEHRPLVLSPDAIWLTIAQGAALHVRLHAEALRGRLVRHQGRKKLTVDYLGVPSTAEEWARVVGAFRGLVAELVGDGRARLLTCDFSTTTPEARVASEIVLMDVYAPYCDYEVRCICGIPEVTLLGTAEDWRAIRQRIDVIAELDLGFWTRSLAPIADQLVATAEGRPDLAFWRDIYKPEPAYGAEKITGWIARLFPYGGGLGQYDQRNPLLDFPLGKLPRQQQPGPFYDGPGIASDWVPRGTAQVLIDLRDGGAGCGDRDVILEGGLLGVEQDEAGRLAPVAGWLARAAAASTAALLERLRQGPHQLEPALPAQQPPTGSVELVTLYRELHAATLFPGPGAWRLRPRSEHERIQVTMVPGTTCDVERILDLPDGTTVCVAYVQSGRRWVRLRVDALGPLTPPGSTVSVPWSTVPVVLEGVGQRTTSQTAPEVPVLEGTLTEILTQALETGGDTDLVTLGETLQVIASSWHGTPPPTKEELAARREAARAEREERRRKKQERQAELRARLDPPAGEKP
jgi:Domain of unknown function (DUF4419)